MKKCTLKKNVKVKQRIPNLFFASSTLEYTFLEFHFLRIFFSNQKQTNLEWHVEFKMIATTTISNWNGKLILLRHAKFDTSWFVPRILMYATSLRSLYSDCSCFLRISNFSFDRMSVFRIPSDVAMIFAFNPFSSDIFTFIGYVSPWVKPTKTPEDRHAYGNRIELLYLHGN